MGSGAGPFTIGAALPIAGAVGGVVAVSVTPVCIVEPAAVCMGSVAATTTAPTPTTALAAITPKTLTSRAFTATPSPPTGITPLGESNGVGKIFTCADPTAAEYTLFAYINSARYAADEDKR